MCLLRPYKPEWHGPILPPSRCGKNIEDRQDALLSLENFERYRQQSANSHDNQVAQLPPRAAINKELAPV